MWFDEMGEIIEMFKGSFPLSFLFFVPIFIIISPVCPVNAAQEFGVYRMQHYDLQGTSYGCKNAIINMEARSIDSKLLTRRCAVARLQDVTMAKYKELMTQNAGSLLVILPKNLTALSPEEKQHLQSLEQDLLVEPSTVPVYFTVESEYINDIYKDIQEGTSGDNAATAWEALLSSALANGFQLVLSGNPAEALPDFEIANIQGRLSGYGIEEQLPSIVISAHYDASGIAPGLAYGADSNGSGMIILLELARLFSKLYTNSRTHAKYNLVFLLSGGGKFNYQGSKKWIEDNFEGAEGNILSDVAFVLCLDTLGATDNINLHVSKPPREDSAGGQFFQHISDVASEYFPEVKVGMVHKKINLADEMLAWEHERFSIKRMLAFTLSHLDTHKSPERTTILDQREKVKLSVISRNTQLIAEGLARQIYNLTSQGNLRMFKDTLAVEESVVESWLDYVTSIARAAQLLKPDSELLMTLEQTMGRYLKDVKKTVIKADKRDPEFVFYSGAEYVMNAYNVKPAVFDLFLALCIAGYLALTYLCAQNFHIIYYALKKTVMPVSPKSKVY
ncbi:BOS complex subunit ncln-like [Biomphalaria glabrata]|uniref:Nicalin n=1 Tax=Biomphalaria glabrata TaxID=6526 RepID=A0A9W2YNX7_BIOGL|nr:BOS complex subunit ncln-like [Biomphalaria glabrata]KAI8768969.1 nicalin-1 [Biomphalaria glabrata]KAI8789197.1 nicalin-1 [Biomphalaria glabrata]